MTPLYHTQISQIHFGEGDQHQSYIPLFTVPCSIPFDKYKQDHRTPDAERLLQHRSQLQEQTVQGSTWSNYVARQSSLCQFVREGEEQGPIKWMSSKMRIMRKMMNSDQPTITSKSRRSTNHQQPNQEISSENTLRVCSDCNTTKTPLWRSGPQGPKSLCNACGIRQRKARRAMAASSDVDRMMPFKKRCRFAAAENTKRKLCFEDIVIRLSKSTVCQRSFPQDEKDAAILLMALSCGLICN